MHDVWSRIESWLESNAPEVLRDLQPPASADAIRGAEQELRVELPADVVASYEVHDGQRGAAEPLIDGWAPLRIESVVKHWTTLGELLDKGDFGDNEADARGPVKPLWWCQRWVPLLHNESGDYRCADLDPADGGQPGQIVTFLHAAPDREVVADSFGALLERFADDLEAGVYAVEEGAVVRADA